jgi:predicted nucleotidyltransferase
VTKHESSLNYLTKTEKRAVEQFAKLVRAALGENLIDIEIFGSKVRGDITKDSDIDILIVVKNRTIDVMDKIAQFTSELNLEFNHFLSPVIFSEYEYKVNKDMASPFTLSIEREGVVL